MRLAYSPMSAHSPLGIKDAVSPASAANWKSNCRKNTEVKGTKNSGLDFYLKAVVCPASKLHVAVLVIKGEPGDVDGA